MRDAAPAGAMPGMLAGTLPPVPRGRALVLALDTLVAGVHFLEDVAPADLGHKALAVNLSDLAAMGARPAAALVSVTRPGGDPRWLDALHRGMDALAATHGVRIAARADARGPLAVTVEASGHVAPADALRRSGARAGDAVCVTGTLGDAGLALALATGEARAAPADARFAEARLTRPSPRLAAGAALAGAASAAIDVSDGLAADLGHVLAASGVGARVELARLPLSPALARSVPRAQAWRLALTAGDDYELCFTLAPERAAELERLAEAAGCAISAIGTIERTPGLRLVDPDGGVSAPGALGRGHDHFR